ncbi:MAG: YbaY family lipoprotein [Pseudomonas sp.]
MKTSTLTRRALCASGMLLLLTGCSGTRDATDMPAGMIRLEGTASYRERMALPPDAKLEVVIEDVSLADAPAQMVAKHHGTTRHGQVPIHFSVEYPAARIAAGHRYGVRARIEQQGTLLFITDTFHPLPPAGSALDLTLVHARPAQPAATLENTYWKLLRLGETEVIVAQGQAGTAHDSASPR